MLRESAEGGESDSVVELKELLLEGGALLLGFLHVHPTFSEGSHAKEANHMLVPTPPRVSPSQAYAYVNSSK